MWQSFSYSRSRPLYAPAETGVLAEPESLPLCLRSLLPHLYRLTNQVGGS